MHMRLERYHLALAEGHLAAARWHIHRQIVLIRWLRARELDDTVALALLQALRGADYAMRAHRRLIVGALVKRFKAR